MKRSIKDGLPAFGLALLLGALGQALVWQERADFFRQALGWSCFALGAWSLLRAHKQAFAGSWKDPESRWPLWAEGLGLALVLALAVWARVHDIQHYPNAGFRDEGQNGSIAINLLQGETVEGTDTRTPVYIEYNTQNAAGYFYPVALMFKLFGVSITSVRYVSVFFGILSVLAFYFLARSWFGAALGLFLALVLASLRWHVNFSRIGFLGMMTVFWSVPLIYFLLRGLRRPAAAKLVVPKRLLAVAVTLAVARGLLGYFPRLGAAEPVLGLAMTLPMLWVAFRAWKDPRSRDLMLGAVALALAMYSYIAARLLVIFVLLVVLQAVLTQKGVWDARLRRRLLWLLALGALGAALLVGGSARELPALKLLGKLGLALGALAFGLTLLAQRKAFKGWVQPLGLALGLGLSVAGPLYAYTLGHWDEVNARSDRVSIFNDKEIDYRPWGAKLLQNIPRTLGMTNIHGDANPRHNLPGELVMGPVWGALFALGMLFVLARLSDPRSWVIFALWQVSLLAGYFSIEAPQTYRTIGALPAMVLTFGMLLETLLVGLKRRLGRDWWIGALAAGLLLGLPAGVWELHTYFERQPKHAGVWAEFSALEYMLGNELKSLQAEKPTRGLVRADWGESYTYYFVTWPQRNFESFDVSQHVPLRELRRYGDQRFVYMLGQSYLPLVGVLRSYYPNGVYREQKHPFTGELMYWTYLIDAKDAQAASTSTSGLRARYFNDKPITRELAYKAPHWRAQDQVRTQVDPFILFDWTVAPVTGAYSVEWTGSLIAPRSGDYTMQLRSNSYGSLEIDGRKVLERPFMPVDKDWAEVKVRLDAGRHRVRLRYFEGRNYSRMEWWWTLPGEKDKQVVPSTALRPE